MIQEMIIHQFIGELSSKQPTPGGGGAAALSGALGTALGEMVVNLTVGKKKYRDVEEKMKELLEKLEALKAEFLRLADEDARVFAPLAAAYAMPKETEEERQRKETVLEANLLSASLVPITVMERSLEAIEILDVLANQGSRMAVSDVGVAVQHVRAALLGAFMNVQINTRSMKDRDKARELNQHSARLKEQGTLLADEIYGRVAAELS